MINRSIKIARPRKSQLLLLLTTLLSLSFACNLPRSLVDRDDFACEEAGGEWVIGDSGPWCKFPSTHETDPSTSQNPSHTIPVGTYIGTINYPLSWSEYLQGENTKNEVTIQIRDDGTVEGSFSLIFVGPHETYDYGDVTCSGYSETEMYGSFARQISGSHGIIGVSENWDCRLFYDCNDRSTICFDDRQYDFEITITGEQMSGTPLGPDLEPDAVWTFNATRE